MVGRGRTWSGASGGTAGVIVDAEGRKNVRRGRSVPGARPPRTRHRATVTRAPPRPERTACGHVAGRARPQGSAPEAQRDSPFTRNGRSGPQRSRGSGKGHRGRRPYGPPGPSRPSRRREGTGPLPDADGRRRTTSAPAPSTREVIECPHGTTGSHGVIIHRPRPRSGNLHHAVPVPFTQAASRPSAPGSGGVDGRKTPRCAALHTVRCVRRSPERRPIRAPHRPRAPGTRGFTPPLKAGHRADTRPVRAPPSRPAASPAGTPSPGVAQNRHEASGSWVKNRESNLRGPTRPDTGDRKPH